MDPPPFLSCTGREEEREGRLMEVKWWRLDKKKGREKRFLPSSPLLCFYFCPIYLHTRVALTFFLSVGSGRTKKISLCVGGYFFFFFAGVEKCVLFWEDSTRCCPRVNTAVLNLFRTVTHFVTRTHQSIMRPNQQRSSNKLPTELRCRNFANKHRLSIQIGAKLAKRCMQCVHIPTELPVCMPPLVVGWHMLRIYCIINNLRGNTKT